MARQRFDWATLPTGLLRRLQRDLSLGRGEAATALRRAFGTRPDEAFVRLAWPVLRERWVAKDPVVRHSVVTALRARGLGDRTIKLSGARLEVEYLRSCRNSPALRSIVLSHLVALGAEVPLRKLPASGRSPSVTASISSTRKEAWSRFSDQIAGVLAQMEEGQFLVLSVRGRPEYYVQFVQGRAKGLRAETVSNSSLEEWEQLDDEAQERLLHLGWELPSGMAKSKKAGRPSNYSRTWSAPVPFTQAATLAVHTFDEVLEVRRPEELTYKASARGGAELFLPNLGIAREQREPSLPSTHVPSHAELLEQVKEVMKGVLHVDSVATDSDGDIPIRVDSAIVFVRVQELIPIVSVFSPVVWGLGTPSGINETLNEINSSIRFARATWDGSSVTLAAEVVGDPLEAAQLKAAFWAVVTLAAEYAPKLQERYGGRIAFGPALPPKHEAVGGYL